MKTGTWDYSIDAATTLEKAHALLSDISRQGELHPLITQVVELPPVPGALKSYAITDKLKLGPIPLTITYFADQLSINDTEIVTVARQKPRTTVRNRTTLTPTEQGVRIDVVVEMTAPSALFSFGYREGRKAHLELARRIKTVLESQG